MSSFKRKTTSTQAKLPAGTRLSPSSASVLNTSTGIPSLDDILGGGLQLATSLLVLTPDPHSAHGELFHKYFIAQALASGQRVCVFDDTVNGKTMVNACMWIPGMHALSSSHAGADDNVSDGEGLLANDSEVKIAWRYEHMQKFNTTIDHTSSNRDDYCRPFDLTHRIPESILESAMSSGQLTFVDPFNHPERDPYETVINWMNELARTTGEDGTPDDDSVLRISIPSLASPLWGDPQADKIMRFMYQLRGALRSSKHLCALITMPAYLCTDAWGGPGWVQKLGWMSDGCITLDSFTADPAMSALFPSYHGLLQIHSLPSLHTLVPPSDRFSSLRGLSSPSSASSAAGVGENNLAFKVTRKRFLFETLHLDVEGGVGERRTTPAASSFALEGGTSAESAALSEFGKADHHPIAAVEVAFDTGSKVAAAADDVATGSGDIQPRPKVKPKKKVGFRSDRPELYDF